MGAAQTGSTPSASRIRSRDEKTPVPVRHVGSEPAACLSHAGLDRIHCPCPSAADVLGRPESCRHSPSTERRRRTGQCRGASVRKDQRQSQLHGGQGGSTPPSGLPACTIVTSRTFVEKAKLELPDAPAIVWLEDLAQTIRRKEVPRSHARLHRAGSPDRAGLWPAHSTFHRRSGDHYLQQRQYGRAERRGAVALQRGRQRTGRDAGSPSL